MRFRKNEEGQTIVITVLALVAILGMCALVLDVGSWFRVHRSLQATADAAALAGAQDLPTNPAAAKTLAMTYANKNGGNVLAANISVYPEQKCDPRVPNRIWVANTICVKAAKSEAGNFSRVLQVNSANLVAYSVARVDVPQQARFVAPITVNDKHPLIHGSGSCPCFGEVTTLPLGKSTGGARQDAPGAFNMVNLDGSQGGTGPATLADWMLNGYSGYLDLGDYLSDPGAKFNSSEMKNALDKRIGTVLLFPVYDVLTGNGAGAAYHVIGWIGFHVTGYTMTGDGGSLTGYFTKFIAQGILNPDGNTGLLDYGVRSIQLTG